MSDTQAKTLQEKLQQVLAMPDGEKRKEMLEEAMLSAGIVEEQVKQILCDAFEALQRVGVKL